MTRLHLDGLTKRFGAIVAVRDVALTVESGEFLTLLGPSGCGKTTLLRMIAGFVTPDSGDILFDDRIVTKTPPNRRNTAMVFQSYALFPHMTVAGNVGFGLRARGVPAAQQTQKIAQALEMVDLQGLEKRRPAELSGGQQQRVALARAIVTSPDLLLFDEPLSNLDAKLREKVRLDLRDLQKRLCITSVFVTHDQAEAMSLSDRIAVMEAGRIRQIGDPRSIYRTPTNEFVASFVGVANLVQGKVVEVVAGSASIDTPLGLLSVSGDGLRQGSTANLTWRPEDMTLQPQQPGNRIEGIVRHVIFMGGVTELVVETKAGLLRAHVFGDVPITEGETRAFGVAAGKVRLLA